MGMEGYLLLNHIESVTWVSVASPNSVLENINHSVFEKICGFFVAFSWMVNQLSPCGTDWSTHA